jgi:hypothetical protein
MRPMIGIVAAVALTASVAACASDPYARSNYNYGYSAPGYTYSAPAYYRSPAYYQTTTYSYSSPQRGYSSYWDYQRNYRGIHSAPEL